MEAVPRRRDSLACWVKFQARIEELGGRVLESEWLGTANPHRVRCALGHESTPRPRNVLSGAGLCRTCAGNDPRVAEAAFRARIAELGGTILEPKWLGVGRPHRVLCAAGHSGTPRPSDVKQGDGICKTCAGTDSRAAEAAFRARVEELGGTVLEPVWLGSIKPHRIRCAAGHETKRPPNSIQQGQGLCRTCAGNDPKVSEAAFRARVQALGGEVLEPVWLGALKPHRIRCSSGHETTPRPTALQQGSGLCRLCVGKTWDVFYVVADEINDTVKFGITSGDPRPRLGIHARDGFDSVVRLIKGLPSDLAPRLERAVLAALRDAREAPVRGREYFPARVLGLVLDVVDGWTSVPRLPDAG